MDVTEAETSCPTEAPDQRRLEALLLPPAHLPGALRLGEPSSLVAPGTHGLIQGRQAGLPPRPWKAPPALEPCSRPPGHAHSGVRPPCPPCCAPSGHRAQHSPLGPREPGRWQPPQRAGAPLGLPDHRFHSAGNAEVRRGIDYIARKKGGKAAGGEKQHPEGSLW